MALPIQLSSLEYPQHGTKHPGAAEMQMMRCCSLKIDRDDARRNGWRVSAYLRVDMRVREIIARTILRNAVDTRLRNLGIRKARQRGTESPRSRKSRARVTYNNFSVLITSSKINLDSTIREQQR